MKNWNKQKNAKKQKSRKAEKLKKKETMILLQKKIKSRNNIRIEISWKNSGKIWGKSGKFGENPNTFRDRKLKMISVKILENSIREPGICFRIDYKRFMHTFSIIHKIWRQTGKKYKKKSEIITSDHVTK